MLKVKTKKKWNLKTWAFPAALATASGLLAMSLTPAAGAADTAQHFNVQGQLFNEEGTTPLSGSATLNFGIYDPSGTCLLYEESQDVDLSSTQGVFSSQVGSAQGSTKRTGLDAGHSMKTVFSNMSAFSTSSSCPSGYTPASGEARKLRITVTPSGGTAIVLAPDQTISAAPSAWSADTLGGKSAGDFIQAAGNVSQASVDLLTNGADASSLHHHDSQYVKAGQSVAIPPGSYLSLGSRSGDPSGLQPTDAGKTWFDSANGVVKFWDGHNVQTLGAASSSAVQSIVAGSTSLTVSGTSSATIDLSSTVKNQLSSIANKLDSALDAGKIWIGNGAGAAQAVAISGDLDLSTLGELTLKTSGVTAGTYTKVTVDSKGRVTGNGVLGVADVSDLPVISSGSTANALVKRDSSGNFSAGQITASTLESSKLVGGSTASSSLTLQATSGSGVTGADIVFKAGNNGSMEAMRIAHSGNVGIGTTIPTYKLDVQGQVNATGGLCLAGNCISSWPTGGGNFIFNSNTLTTTVGSSPIFTAGEAASTTSTGNSVTLQGGAGGSTMGAGGSVTIVGGTATSGAGGSVNITAANGVGTNHNGGNVTITAGSAAGTGVAGGIHLHAAGAERMGIEASGRIYGNPAQHRPLGSAQETGASAMYMESGTFTPVTVNTIIGTPGVSFGKGNYMRVGNVVTFAGSFTYTASSANSPTAFNMTLPLVNGNFTEFSDVAGTSVGVTSSGSSSGAFSANVGSNTARLNTYNQSTIAEITHYFTLTYEIKPQQ